MRAEEAISVSNNYTNQTVIGMGAIKGAPCTIKSMTKAGKLTTTVFEWTDINGGKHENTMLVYDGTDGTNGTNGQDGAPGADGFSPTIVVKTSTSTEYILTITDKNGSYDTPNLKGSGGGGGASEMSDLTDVDLTNLANGSALIYDSEAAKWEATDLTLSNITDIDLTGIQDGQVLVWDAEHSKLVPANQTGTQYSAGEGINIDQNNVISSKFVLYTGAKETYEAMPLSERVKYTHTAFDNDSQVGLVDAVPTENSQNLVTSGGTYSEIAKKANTTDLANYQTKDLSSPITVDGTQETTVEGALGAVNTLAAGKADPATTIAGYGITNAYTKTETDGAITSEIEKLDVADSVVAGSYVTGVSETDGKISVTREAADAAPTSASNKMIKSGGVYSAVDDVYKANGVLGTKNLLPFDLASIKANNTTGTWNGNVYTLNGVTFTFNEDGSVLANGPASANAEVDYLLNFAISGDFILSDEFAGVANNYWAFANIDGDSSNLKILTTEEIPVSISSTITYFRIKVFSGKTADNILFKPMLRLTSDTDSTYQPYAKSNQELTNDSVDWDNMSNIGSVNIMKYPYTATTQTSGGIDITDNGDGSITTVAGTVSSSQSMTFWFERYATGMKVEDLIGKTFKFSADMSTELGLPKTTARIEFSIADSSDNTISGTAFHLPIGTAHNEQIFTIPNGADHMTIMMWIAKNTVLPAFTLKPMITPVEYNGPYAPYAMTNRQLSKSERGSITYSIQATETSMTALIKAGKVVQCNMMASLGEDVSAWTTFATIPEGFRPASYVQAVNNKTMYTGFNIIQISPQGAVQSSTPLASGDKIRFTAVWLLP